MSNYFTFQVESIPPYIFVVFIITIFFFFANYFFKKEIILGLKKTLYKNELIELCFGDIFDALNNKDNENNDNNNKNNISRICNNKPNLSNNNNDNFIKEEEIENQCKKKLVDFLRFHFKDFKQFFINNNQYLIVSNSSIKEKNTFLSNKEINIFLHNTFFNDENKNQNLLREDNINQLFNLTNSNEKLDILDTLINSLPVKNFLYTVLLKKIKDLCEREIFISFSEFKVFFYGEVENEIQLKLVIIETIEKRNELKSTKVFCLLQILLAILLSILTNKIFSYVTFHNNYIQGIIIVIFSFLYMTLLIIECLVLISLIDYEKYFYSNILSQSEKLFLEQEFSEEPNYNNELF